MKISFPQNLFDSPPIYNIIGGKEIASKSKILFCGIARNTEKTLSKNIARIHYVGKRFKEYDIFIYENNSTDNTVNILKDSNVNFISENRLNNNYWDDIKSGKTDHLHRCIELAECRNNYLDYARINRSDYDYVCVLDWDTMGFSYKGFYDSLYRLQENSLASVSAYGLLSDVYNESTLEQEKDSLLMYDSFAFRPKDCFKYMSQAFQSAFNYLKFKEPTEVRSNFGGMAIYKTKILLDHKYKAERNYGFVDCDHVCLNLEILKNNFKHLLNPYLVVSYSKHRFDNN